MSSSTWEDKNLAWQKAREVLPLARLMTELGDGAFTSKKPPGCPFCGPAGKGKFSIFQSGGKDRFKCFNLDCVANTPENSTEIGYLMLKRGLSKKEAEKEYLRIAVPDLVPHLFGHSGDYPPGIIAPAEFHRKEGPRDSAAKNPWHALWKKLPLTADDQAKLAKVRGFNQETIDLFGFRSNNPGNQPALQQLIQEYPMDVLLETGLVKMEFGRPKPSGQFAGWGITDRKDPKTGRPIFEITEPIIIPYQDATGVPFYLRPHKGGVKQRVDQFADVELFDDDVDPEPEVCSAHVFSPYILAELIAQNDGEAIFTEGEFKAAALVQCGLAGIACPGISFIRNGKFRRELLDLLKKFDVRHMTVIFDNEEKDNPDIPKRYKANPQKRWDTVVYAEYTCIDLRNYFESVGGSCLIGKLPDEYRVDGKADFDGILAQQVEKYGMEQGTKAATRIFRETIAQAAERPGLDLFPTECRRVVERNLMRFFYKPKGVFIAGWKEQSLAKRFSEIGPTGEPVDLRLASLYRGLKGCYFKRGKTDSKERIVLNAELTAWKKDISELKAKSPLDDEDYRHLSYMYGKVAACWEQIKGLPEEVSNFTLSCEYKIHTEHGDVHRLVSVRDSKDTKAHIEEREADGMSHTGLRKITPGDLARLADFRKWCLGTGQAIWLGGEKELQMLTVQMDHNSFLSDIHEVSTYGWHRKSNIWFFGDVAYHNGKKIIGDQSGIFWHDGIGYQIEASSAADAIGQNFAQGAPLLLKPHNAPVMEKPDIAVIFATFAQDMYLTVGTYEAWLMIGNILTYAIAPELVKEFGGHPGLWLSGIMSSGKTSIARWLCRFWGFKELGGIRLDDSTTHTAMNRFLAQYSCLPVWMDEYRQGQDDPQKESVLRGAFDRSSGAKGVPDGTNKTKNATTFTTPIVSGESSSRDAATRSRYININVSLHNRIGDGTARFPRIQNDAEHYYLLGAWIMEHREAFVAESMKRLRQWMETPDVKSHMPNARTRFVYGTSYATFEAMAVMLNLERSVAMPHDLEVPSEPERKMRVAMARLLEFEKFLYRHGESALQDVQDETFLSQFWRDIVDGLRRGAVKAKFFRVGWFSADSEGTLTKVRADEPGARKLAFMDAAAIFSEYQKDKAQRHEEVRMSINNIRRDVERQPYWIPIPKSKTCRAHRISMEGGRPSCWVIDVEGEDEYTQKFPLALDLLGCLPQSFGGDKIIPKDDD